MPKFSYFPIYLTISAWNRKISSFFIRQLITQRKSRSRQLIEVECFRRAFQYSNYWTSKALDAQWAKSSIILISLFAFHRSLASLRSRRTSHLRNKLHQGLVRSFDGTFIAIWKGRIMCCWIYKVFPAMCGFLHAVRKLSNFPCKAFTEILSARVGAAHLKARLSHSF